MFSERVFLGLLGLAFTVMGVEGLDVNNTLNSTEASSSLLLERGSKVERLVFAHFVVTSTTRPSYNSDMKLAKSVGIDAFALNIGLDPGTDDQLSQAYTAASKTGMKVFISLDFSLYKTSDAQSVASVISRYAKQPAQLIYNGKIFASSFQGDGLDVDAVRKQVKSATGKDLYFAPNFHPKEQGGVGLDKLDGALNWMAWRNNGQNRAPNSDKLVTVDQGDRAYLRALSGKGYIAPVSPWFSTHFGPEVAYSKNWVFPGDLLLYNRWLEILSLQPPFVELLSWNDFGESHYIGPLSSRHKDDGASKWVNDMPHTGWLTLQKPFIDAYKAGSTTLSTKFINGDRLIYWYRTHPAGINCDQTDTTMGNVTASIMNYAHGRPDGYATLTDTISVVAFLRSPAVVSIQSGGTQYLSSNLPAGASALSVPFNNGTQRFSIMRDGKEVIGATSLKQIKPECPCGLYNFNPYVGTVTPESTVDSLDSDGLAAFSKGLKVDCKAQPSLPATPPATAQATRTVSVSAVASEKV